MPIRDMDMYAAGPPASHAAALHPQGVVSVPVGVRVAANRGASGIDGVVSTAAGYAAGLGRSTTLVIGDVSFVHDSNGLGLLRSGTACSFQPTSLLLLQGCAFGCCFNDVPFILPTCEAPCPLSLLAHIGTSAHIGHQKSENSLLVQACSCPLPLITS